MTGLANRKFGHGDKTAIDWPTARTSVGRPGITPLTWGAFLNLFVGTANGALYPGHAPLYNTIVHFKVVALSDVGEGSRDTRLPR